MDSLMPGGASDVFLQGCKIGKLYPVNKIQAIKDRGDYAKNEELLTFTNVQCVDGKKDSQSNY